ncbi:MAG: hypothetical protein IE914_03025 [Thiotrichales bacterium]|nr:hypothetical protein [Thiotrichales bacterium]
MTPNEIPPLAIGAITAALITAAISLLGLIISKEQKVSEFRQAWIDALRTELSSVISHANALCDVRSLTNLTLMEKWALGRENLTKINTDVSSIRLRLNKDEPEAQAILKSLDALESAFSSREDIDITPRIHEIESDLIEKSQIFLSKEWSRVKNGEPIYNFSKYAALVIIIVLLILGVYFFI